MSHPCSFQNRHAGNDVHNEDIPTKNRLSVAIKSHVLEEIHVKRVYEQIAPHILDLKHRTWPGVKDFLESMAAGSLVADVGCGNGRYLSVNPCVFKIGLDICSVFLESAAAQGFEVLSANNLSLPFRDGIFDGIISIGVLHHLASTERQLMALHELSRVLRPGGRLMIYVWAFEQKHRRFDSQDILVPWHPPHKTERRQSKHSSSLTSSDTDRCSTSSAGSSISDDDSPGHQCCRHNTFPGACNSNLELVKRKKSEESCSEEKCKNCDGDLVKECQRVESFLSNLTFKAGAVHQPCVLSKVSSDFVMPQSLGDLQRSDSIVCKVSSNAVTLQPCVMQQALGAHNDFSLPQVSDLPSKAEVSNAFTEHHVQGAHCQIKASTIPSSPQLTTVCGHPHMSSISSQRHAFGISSQPKASTMSCKTASSCNQERLQHIRKDCRSDTLSLECTLPSKGEVENNTEKRVSFSAVTSDTCSDMKRDDVCHACSSLPAKQDQSIEQKILKPSQNVLIKQKLDSCEATSWMVNGLISADRNGDKDCSLCQSECTTDTHGVNADWCVVSDVGEEQVRPRRGSKVIKDVTVSGSSTRARNSNGLLNNLSASTDDSAYQSNSETCSWQEDDVFLVLDEDILSSENGSQLQSNSHTAVSEIFPLIQVFKQGIKSMFSKSKSETAVRGVRAPCFMPCIDRSHCSTFQVRKFPQSSLPQVAGEDEVFQDDGCSEVGDYLIAEEDKLPSVPNVTSQVSDNHTDHCTTQDLILQPRKTQQSEKRCTSHLLSCKGVSDVSSCKSCCSHASHKKTARWMKSHAAFEVKETRSSHILTAAVRKSETVDTDLCRFYHVFREGELDSLIMQHVPQLKIVRSYYDHANWCLVLEKTLPW